MKTITLNTKDYQVGSLITYSVGGENTIPYVRPTLKRATVVSFTKDFDNVTLSLSNGETKVLYK
tara:strand:- start:513 stop:704 length:192 start_codon:yes stop_codon:yes gene_type:complete